MPAGHGWNGSRAARRIDKARKELLAGTRRRLQIQLAMDRSDFDQLMGLIASRLDLSIERFLVERDGPAEAAAGDQLSSGTQ